MIWSAVSERRITGAFAFQNEKYKIEAYRMMLTQYEFSSRRAFIEVYIFQLEGASPHQLNRVIAYMNSKCKDKWFGWGDLGS